jgi:hypothetical protein
MWVARTSEDVEGEGSRLATHFLLLQSSDLLRALSVNHFLILLALVFGGLKAPPTNGYMLPRTAAALLQSL